MADRRLTPPCPPDIYLWTYSMNHRSTPALRHFKLAFKSQPLCQSRCLHARPIALSFFAASAPRRRRLMSHDLATSPSSNSSYVLIPSDRSSFSSTRSFSNSMSLSTKGGVVPAPAAALDFVKFSDASPDPFHAVQTCVVLLEAAGFKRLREEDSWDHSHLEKGGKYYFTRNQSALVAFAVGHNFVPGKSGVHLVGAHTDSPCFKLKPVTKKEKVGFMQVGVETYGGGLWTTWWDRDLGLAGRVIVSESTSKDCAKFQSRLVHINRPILRIPNLAIHLNRGANDGYKADLEENMVPILGMAQKNVADQLNSTDSHVTGLPHMQSKHHPALLRILAQELKVEVEQIQDFELSLFDTQGATIGGANNEFINAARLDNQMSCFCAVTGLLLSLAPGQSTLDSTGSIRAICLFDNEEVGSVSTHGADSNMLPSLIRRLAGIKVHVPSNVSISSGPEGAGSDSFDASMAASFLISSDVAHSIHPNYTSYYEPDNSPRMNHGIVIKTNYKQRYASTAATTFALRRWAKLARAIKNPLAPSGAAEAEAFDDGVPLQEFSIRNNLPCGSTIGPILSKSGIRTVDIGSCVWAMHSIRECHGSWDVERLINLFESFFNRGEEVLSSIQVD